MKHAYWALTACVVTASSYASAMAAAATEATDPNVKTPPVIYRSPFAEYRPLGEDRSTAWKDANETVEKIGGWRAYAREAADAMKAREAASAARIKPEAVPPAPAKPAGSPPQTHKHGG